MRVRTLVAGVTLAMMTMVVAAPAALAVPNDPPPNPPTGQPSVDPTGPTAGPKDQKKLDPQKVQPAPSLAAKAPVATLKVAEDTVEAGKSFTITEASCTEGGAGTLSAPGFIVLNGLTGGSVKPDATAGSATITLTCKNATDTATASDKFDVVAAPAAAKAPAPVAPAAANQADLKVPDKVLFDDNFDVDAKCTPGTVTSITSNPGGVTFNGGFTQGNLPNSIPAGTEVELTLTCSTGATDKAKLLVVDNDKGPFLNLDPNEGFRQDEVDVEAYCPGAGDADLKSNILKEIKLKRAGNGNLYGQTKVRDDATFGYSDETRVECPGEDPHDKFWVLEHRKADLKLDPAFGKRGDEIKVRVICDFTVGKLDSGVLDDIEVKHNGDDPKWRYRGTTHVVSDAKAGEHTVKIRCGDDTLEAEFFVIVDGDGKGGSQNSVYPKGAPQTGGGPVGGGPVGGGPVGALGFAGLTGVATAPARRMVRR